MVKIYLVVILVIFGTVQQLDAKPKVRKLASYIVPCHKDDPKLNECWLEHGNEALKTIVEGDSAYKIRELHPLKIDDIVLQPSPNLKLHFSKVIVNGIEKTKLTDGDWNLDNKKLKVKVNIPRLDIIGEYEADGKILILPVNGKGDGNITFINVVFDYSLEYTVDETNGIELVHFKDHDMTYKSEHVYYDLTNLFNGNKALSEQTLKFLNENWEDIDKEVSGSLIEIIKQLAKEIILNLVKNVPYDEIFLP